MNDAFLARVSFAGVPHNIAHSTSVAEATVFPISPPTLCQIYWMLSKLNVSYAYKINGVEVRRNFVVSSVVSPKLRLIAPATFYHTGYDSQTQTSYVVELHLEKVFFKSENLSQVGLNLNFEESDSFNFISLKLRPQGGMGNVSKSFTIFGQTLTAYLNYNASMVSSAEIMDFSIVPEFFSI